MGVLQVLRLGLRTKRHTRYAWYGRSAARKVPFGTAGRMNSTQFKFCAHQPKC
jgi:hypothetical protein